MVVRKWIPCRQSKAERLADIWYRRQVNYSRDELRFHARRIVDLYSKHPSYNQDKMEIPYNIMLAEVIQPEKGLVVEPPLDPVAFVQTYWTHKWLNQFEIHRDSVAEESPVMCTKFKRRKHKDTNLLNNRLQIYFAKPQLKLEDSKAERNFWALQTWAMMKLMWQQEKGVNLWTDLLQSEDKAVKNISLSFFGALAVANSLKHKEQSTEFVNYFTLKVSSSKDKTFRELRAFLDLIMLQNSKFPPIEVNELQIRHCLEMSGGIGLAVSEGNAAIFQYWYDCIIYKLSSQDPENNSKQIQHYFNVRRCNALSLIAAKKNHTQILEKLAKIILTHNMNLEIVYDRNLLSIIKSHDDEPDLYYFGTKIGKWTELIRPNQNGVSVFSEAAKTGNKLVEDLIHLANLHSVDTKVLLIPDHYKRTPLHWALLNKHYETAKIILNFAHQRGFNASSLLGPDVYGLSPVALCKDNEDISEVVQNFCSYYDIRVAQPDEEDSSTFKLISLTDIASSNSYNT